MKVSTIRERDQFGKSVTLYEEEGINLDTEV